GQAPAQPRSRTVDSGLPAIPPGGECAAIVLLRSSSGPFGEWGVWSAIQERTSHGRADRAPGRCRAGEGAGRSPVLTDRWFAFPYREHSSLPSGAGKSLPGARAWGGFLRERADVPDAHAPGGARGQTLAVWTERQPEDGPGMALKGEDRPARAE